MRTMFRQLSIRFETREQFREEFEANISRGGMFIATTDRFEMREVVDVEFDLSFCGESLRWQAEVVSQLGAELSGAGGIVGVAVQFLEASEEVRGRLAELTGIADAGPQTLESPPQRRRRRGSVRAAAEVVGYGGPTSAKAKDISDSGARVSIEGRPVPIGDPVELKILHPRTGEEIRVSGRVVRYVACQDGMYDMAVEFEDADEPTTCAKLGDLRAAAHARRLGGINGSIAALGVPNLIQMFTASSKEGTLTLVQQAREGRVLFQSRKLRHAEIGPIKGAKAVARMLEWTDGDFEFHPSILPGEPENPSVSMDSIMLQALHGVDELSRLDLSGVPPDAHLGVGHEPREELDKLEAAVLDCATLGSSVREVLDALPQFDSEIYGALLGLIDRGVVRTL
jgi:hypothetical protein